LLGEGSLLERLDGTSETFRGLPPFAYDMSPQGFIGRRFPEIYPEFELPARIADWNDDHRLIALARRGEDCIGNLIIGRESFQRFQNDSPHIYERQQYPELVRRALAGQPGSSAGGEQPKFAVYADGRHVLVKFASADDTAASQRWRDLLCCERIALEMLRAAGIAAATASTFDIAGIRFLEVERFDRIGEKGRRGVISLAPLDDVYFGYRDNWTSAAQRLLMQKMIDADDARRMRRLDTFAQLIGNTDRHFGNISFFVKEPNLLQLAPVYDMLPMLFAPREGNIVERPLHPQPPSFDNHDVWSDAAQLAAAYWDRLAASPEIDRELRETCGRCRDRVAAVEAVSE